jgi:hypothetical protein
VEKNGNTLVVECPDDVGAMTADLTKVLQALFNLLSNAAKFTEHGTIGLRVTRATALTPRPPPLRGANIGCADVPTVGEGRPPASPVSAPLSLCAGEGLEPRGRGAPW